jgi:hypothetical protein
MGYKEDRTGRDLGVDDCSECVNIPGVDYAPCSNSPMISTC